MLSRPTLLILDLMDTVVRDPFFCEVPRAYGKPLSALFAERDAEAWPAFERGEIDEPTFLRRLFGGRSDGPDPQILREAIVENYRFIDGMEPLLAELHELTELWVLSNYPVWFERVRQELELDRFFRGYTVSYQIGVRKPDERAYTAVLAASRRDAASCVLIDDRLTNLEPARRLGLQAIHFVGVEALRQTLSSLVARL